MFSERNRAILTTVDARKEKIEAEEAWSLLQQASTVVIAKGKKILRYTHDEMEKDLLLKDILGRSGTLRAPAIRIGTTLYIGFNEEMYKTLA